MNKKKVLWISLIVTATSFIVSPSNLYSYCFQQGHCWQFWNTLEYVAPYLFIFPVLFLFSVITYKMREEVFQAWLRFAYWWIPLSLILIYLAGGTSGGGFGIPNVFDRESVAFIFASLFALISLVLIIVKSILLRNK